MNGWLVVTLWFLAGVGLAYALSAFFRAARAAESRDIAERMTRYVEHRPCPWDSKP